MSKYINIFIRFLFLILALPIICYLGVVQYLGVNTHWLEHICERIISFLQKFLDNYFPVMSE